MKKFYRNLISSATILCLSVGLLSCSSKPAADETITPAGLNTLLESQFINDEAIAKSSTPDSAEDTSNYSEKILSNAGITLQLPEAYVNTDGILTYSDQALDEEDGIYFAYATYIGMSEDEYNSLVNDEHSLTEEERAYIQEKAAPIFAVFAIDNDRDASDLVDYVNENGLLDVTLSVGELTKLTSVDGCTFFDYDFGDTFTPVLEEPYQTEFDALISLKSELYTNATFVAPQRPFSDIIGTRLSFTTTDLNGNEITSDQIFSKNEVTMLNIWATWCSFCVGELPELEEINTRLAKKNCAIVGIMGDDNPSQKIIDLGKAILEDNGVTYLNILPWDDWDNIKPEGWPLSIFVNKEGYIVGMPVKGARPTEYESRIDSILAGETLIPEDEDEETDTSEGSYKIYVVDKNHDPVSGVTVQFCADDVCKMAVTGENGMISFDDPEGIAYEVHILKVPEGYTQDTSLYLTEKYYSDLTIILNKE